MSSKANPPVRQARYSIAAAPSASASAAREPAAYKRPPMRGPLALAAVTSAHHPEDRWSSAGALNQPTSAWGLPRGAPGSIVDNQEDKKGVTEE